MTVSLLGKSWLIIDGPLDISVSLSSFLSLSHFFDDKEGRTNVLQIVCAYKMKLAKYYCILHQTFNPLQPKFQYEKMNFQ